MITTREELQLMTRAAQLYYQENLTQNQVASELGVSRPSVSRLLTLARREGIVQISVIDPFATSEELVQELMETFGLKHAVVVAGEGLGNDLLRRRLGFAAADYLQHTVQNGFRVGIGWGRTLASAVDALPAESGADIRAFPLIGGVGQIDSSFQVNKLAERLADSFGGRWQPFYVPAFVEDPGALKGLLALPDLQVVMQSWSQLDMVLVGVGHFALQRQSSMFFASYMTDEVFQKLEQFGAVGDLCGRFFDIEGRPAYAEPGVIGISLDQLNALGNVVGVAGGPEKVAAILGALRGGYLNVLLTDTVTARAVLDRNRRHG